jgi:hypothetical protein
VARRRVEVATAHRQTGRPADRQTGQSFVLTVLTGVVIHVFDLVPDEGTVTAYRPWAEPMPRREKGLDAPRSARSPTERADQRAPR